MLMPIPKFRFISLALTVLFVALNSLAQQQDAKTLFPVEKAGKFGFIDRHESSPDFG